MLPTAYVAPVADEHKCVGKNGEIMQIWWEKNDLEKNLNQRNFSHHKPHSH
jgi:hypothetical protein